MIRHAVWMKMRDGTTDAQRQNVWDLLRGVGDHVDGMVNCHFGDNSSPEGLDRGYLYGFVMDFEDTASRDAYLIHPAHQAAAAELLALCEGGVDGVLVFDLEI